MPEARHTAFHVIGIGASAGGLESLQRLFDHLPANLGAAFVVVQHLSPDYESMMVQLLQRHTAMPVQIVKEPIRLQPGKVYLLERNTELVIEQGQLMPVERDTTMVPHMPIDRFLVSLAEAYGESATAVILSGTGSDGTRGVSAVKARGGMVIAESRTSAKFTGMPLSARNSGAVDLNLVPEKIGEAIERRVLGKEPQSDEQLSEDRLYAPILQLVGNASEIDFAQYKDATIRRRIERRIGLLELGSADEYLALLRADQSEVNNLLDDLLIGVTRFFRDQQCFQVLADRFIPEIFDRAEADDEIRVWVAGCATGEEAYSIAMLLLEEASRRDGSPPVKVFASDVHAPALQAASAGFYPAERLMDVSQKRIERFFKRENGGFVVSNELREVVVFTRHNAISDPPFTQLSLITCRNVMIYLEPVAQKRLIGLFHFGLREDGLLFLGPSEGLLKADSGFAAEDEKHRIFRRTELPLGARLDLTRSTGPPTPRTFVPRSVTGLQRTRDESGWLEIYDLILSRYLQPAVMVDENQHLVDSYGGVERFLQPTLRRPTGALSEFLDRGTAVSLSAAVRRAARDNQPVKVPGLHLRYGEVELRATARVEPLPPIAGRGNRFLILFDLDHNPARDAEQGGMAPDQAVPLTDSTLAQRIVELEQELDATRENLQLSIEQVEVSNEELQATNEELVASNEEMQSTNEELNSVNEELHTVNSEYQKKNEELSELNRDMLQLLESAEVGIVLVDRELRIRRFSSDMGRVFSLRESDLGRPLTDFAPDLTIDNLKSKLGQVLLTGQRSEYRTLDGQGAARLLRLTPLEDGGEIDGVALSLVDIDELDRASREVEEQERELQQLIDALPILVARVGADQRYQLVNRAYAERWGQSANEITGMTVRQLLGEESYEVALPRIRRALSGQDVTYEMAFKNPDGEASIFLVQYRPARDRNGEPDGFFSAITDVTRLRNINDELVEARLQAEAAGMAKTTFLANISHEIRTPMAAMLGHLELLDRKQVSEEVSKTLSVVQRNGEHLLALINDLLEISALDLGAREPELGPVDLPATLDEVIQLLGNRAEQNGLRLCLHKGDDLPVGVVSDARRLRQILVNLIGNAIKFTERGEVVLGADVDGQKLLLWVSDTGPGIPPDQVERLFRPFEQLDTSSTKSFEGTGLGLSISMRLAEQLGGELTVSSEIGTGSTFTLKLPLVAAPEIETSRTPTRFERESGSVALAGHFLVVDDQLDAREVTVGFLEDEGVRIEVASNGRDALAAVENAVERDDAFDLIFLDIQMPEMDGHEVVRQLRQKGISVPVIALTAGALERDRAASLEAGCSDHVAKPVTRTRLRRIARRWLRGAAGGREGITVLVIDDDENSRTAMKAFFELHSLKSTAVGNGAEALEAAKNGHFDVVVSDITLPDLDGGALAQELKSIEGCRRALYIAVSGWSDSDRPEAARQFDLWLRKPVSMDRLEQLVEQLKKVGEDEETHVS